MFPPPSLVNLLVGVLLMGLSMAAMLGRMLTGSHGGMRGVLLAWFILFNMGTASSFGSAMPSAGMGLPLGGEVLQGGFNASIFPGRGRGGG